MNPDSPTPEATLNLTDGERMTRNKAILLDALTAAGAAQATVGYSGSGDEGFASEAAALAIDNTPVPLSQPVSVYIKHSRYEDRQWLSSATLEEQPLDEALADFAMEAVNHHHGGWENNDGASGEVVFDCAAGTVRIEHNDYFTDSEYTETEL